MLMRSFTRREKVLLVLLAVVLLAGLYVLLIHYPIQNRLNQIEQQRESVEFEISLAEIRQSQYNSMQEELEEIFALPDDELTVMPEYDNLQTLMIHFNRIFQGSEPELSYDPVRINGDVAERTIRFTFAATSYDSARTILEELTGTGFRCLLDSLSIAPNGQDVSSNALSVTGSITFYELVP